jgi:hypothetical protein
MAGFFPHQTAARQITGNNIAYTGNTTSTPSTNFGPQTFLIRACTNISGYLRIDGASGGSVTATTNDMMLNSGFPPEYFHTTPGQACAFVSTSTSSGTVSITEMA